MTFTSQQVSSNFSFYMLQSNLIKLKVITVGDVFIHRPGQHNESLTDAPRGKKKAIFLISDSILPALRSSETKLKSLFLQSKYKHDSEMR